jgi:bacteriorhodopsin
MAEIHVQAKKRGTSAWLWILISVIILGTIAFILLWNNNSEVREKLSKPTSTSLIQYHDGTMQV